MASLPRVVSIAPRALPQALPRAESSYSGTSKLRADPNQRCRYRSVRICKQPRQPRHQAALGDRQQDHSHVFPPRYEHSKDSLLEKHSLPKATIEHGAWRFLFLYDYITPVARRLVVFLGFGGLLRVLACTPPPLTDVQADRNKNAILCC